ncbi:NUDIX hydrolase [Candidatus Microgenomates bacterium]|nr:MAG: NUDIX hydrolase [Candidatus Microgenomates bacterium]
MHIGAAVIVVRPGSPEHVLLVREGCSNTEIGKEEGMLSLPAGHSEASELPSETAVREAYEETGYRIRILHRLEGEYGDENTQGQVFVGEIISTEPKGPIGDDIAAILWAELSQVLCGQYGSLRPQMVAPLTAYRDQFLPDSG